MAHSLPFAPLEMEIAAFFLAFGRLEGRGMRREEQGMRLEEVFAGHEAPSEWEEAGGMRLAGLVMRRLAPALFDNRWSKQGSGRGTLLCSHLYLSNRSRRPHFRSLAAGDPCAPPPRHFLRSPPHRSRCPTPAGGAPAALLSVL